MATAFECLGFHKTCARKVTRIDSGHASGLVIQPLDLPAFPQVPPCESDAKSCGCDIVHLCTCVISRLSSHRVTPISTLRTQPTLVAEQVTSHSVNSRFTARASCMASEDACLFKGSKGERNSSCVQVISVFSFAVPCLSLQRDAVGNHAAYITLETQQVSMTGNSALDYASLVNLVINTMKRFFEVCDGLRGDASVVAHEVGLIILRKLSMEDQSVSTR